MLVAKGKDMRETEAMTQNRELTRADQIRKMEEILQRQADVDVLRPAGSRKYYGWTSVPKPTMARIIGNEKDA